MEKDTTTAAAELAPQARRGRAWTVEQSAELYDVERWGNGYFSIGPQGAVRVHPRRDPKIAIDLAQLVAEIEEREISLPVLLRFGGILEDRLVEIHRAFERACADNDYRGRYVSVYPIKVNQQRQVVEEVQRVGKPYGDGLEAGSKPELLAVLALADNETPIICNGFKDHEYIETVLLAQKVGRKITPVVEKFNELSMILEYARRYDVRPSIGIRVKLATQGSGRWKDSAGYRSKFGLTITEAIDALTLLQAEGMGDCLELLHFHLGSQITNIRQIKSAVTEAARVFVELSRLGAGLRVLDVGGGLGVDYDGSQTNFESSINYTLQEYANDVVFHIGSICEEAGVAHPTIITECGRAISAYHSVLVVNVVGTSDGHEHGRLPSQLDDEVEQPLHDLLETYKGLSTKNVIEAYHDAQQALDEALSLFKLGYLSLERRGLAENLYWAISRKVQKLAAAFDVMPEELEGLEPQLARTYFCNFSVFQSIPDAWAIKQLFPIMPIHRLDEEPKVRAVLGDISCDSDGKIVQFIDRRDVKHTLPLHETEEQPYYLGIFLVGAYQEILGDLHNLFGDTNAVHIVLEDGEPAIDEVVQGDTVKEVLRYVQFDAEDLLHRFRRDIEAAVRAGRITPKESGQLLRFYEDGLRGYTYLE
jgi:arginine decarboxylase